MMTFRMNIDLLLLSKSSVNEAMDSVDDESRAWRPPGFL